MLLAAQRQLGRPPKELENLIELPSSCAHVWQWFTNLSNTRGEGFNGPLPITYNEIKAYFDLMRIEPTPQDWEIALIKSWDIVYLNTVRSKFNEK